MAKKFPVHPAKPERICWGCDTYCAADSMNCGNGSDRTPHPVELFGEDWQDWGHDFGQEPKAPVPPNLIAPLACKAPWGVKTQKF